MTVAVIGLGSSMGERVRNLRLATRLLAAHREVRLLAGSRIWRSPPMGGVARGAFANAAVSIETSLSPQALLSWCKSVEVRVGRRPARRWGDRVVDLDILLYGEEIVREPALEVPHPGLLIRNFALLPAQEAAPGLRHPVTGALLRDSEVTKQGMWPVGVLGLARRG